MKKEMFIEEILFRGERKLFSDGSYRNVLRGAHARYLTAITDEAGLEHITVGEALPITEVVKGITVALGEARPERPEVVKGFPLSQVLSDLSILQQSTIDGLVVEHTALLAHNKKLAEALGEAVLRLKKHGLSTDLKGIGPNSA